MAEATPVVVLTTIVVLSGLMPPSAEGGGDRKRVAAPAAPAARDRQGAVRVGGADECDHDRRAAAVDTEEAVHAVERGRPARCGRDHSVRRGDRSVVDLDAAQHRRGSRRERVGAAGNGQDAGGQAEARANADTRQGRAIAAQ